MKKVIVAGAVFISVSIANAEPKGHEWGTLGSPTKIAATQLKLALINSLCDITVEKKEGSSVVSVGKKRPISGSQLRKKDC